MAQINIGYDAVVNILAGKWLSLLSELLEAELLEIRLVCQVVHQCGRRFEAQVVLTVEFYALELVDLVEVGILVEAAKPLISHEFDLVLCLFIYHWIPVDGVRVERRPNVVLVAQPISIQELLFALELEHEPVSINEEEWVPVA